MKLLRLRRLGDPILRAQARRLNVSEIKSSEIQALIIDIRHTNEVKQYGVGLAAPQVGVSVALSVIGIKPTPTRPDVVRFESVIINPSYEGIGRRVALWEGCQSVGAGRSILYGKVPRYERIRADWHDEQGELHHEELEGFVAHVFQHETDHLQGIMFVDKVRDTKTLMLADEYRKRIATTRPNAHS